MGRVGNNATQQETIDDAFPPPGGIEDNDSIPTTHQTPPLIQPRSKVPPSKSKPPPPQNYHEEEEEEEEDLYYPNSHHHVENPESFPPKYQDQDHDHHQGYAHAFPPNNFYDHGQHQPQPIPPTNNVGIGTNVPFPQHHHQPPRVPIGHPAIALNTTGAVAQHQNRPWNSSLFDCMNDPQNALITACFPCVTFGQIAEIVDSGNTTCGTSGMLYGLIACCIAVPCIMSCTYRTKMRGRFGLIESPAPDWVVHCFCEWCALCQEYRQLKDMNLDPSIGWQGNVAMHGGNQQFTMTPPAGQRMM